MGRNAIQGYAVVCYPDKMDPLWKEKLSVIRHGYAFGYHDHDVFEKDCVIAGKTHKRGDPKETHYHILFMDVPPKKQRKAIAEIIGRTAFEYVYDVAEYYEYLTHSNKPDKYQYPEENRQVSENWDWDYFDSIKEASERENRNLFAEIIQIVKEQHIMEYSDLCDYVLLEMKDLELLNGCKNAAVKNYINSLRYSEKEKEEKTFIKMIRRNYSERPLKQEEYKQIELEFNENKINKKKVGGDAV